MRSLSASGRARRCPGCIGCFEREQQASHHFGVSSGLLGLLGPSGSVVCTRADLFAPPRHPYPHPTHTRARTKRPKSRPRRTLVRLPHWGARGEMLAPATKWLGARNAGPPVGRKSYLSPGSSRSKQFSRQNTFHRLISLAANLSLQTKPKRKRNGCH